MNISRKDFLRKSLYSLGEAVGSIAGILKSPDAAETHTDAGLEFIPEPRENLAATARNEHCLARSSGCFSCIERCDQQAIKLIPGVGIRINPRLCNGCGVCEYVCPVMPKAVILSTRPTK